MIFVSYQILFCTRFPCIRIPFCKPQGIPHTIIYQAASLHTKYHGIPDTRDYLPSPPPSPFTPPFLPSPTFHPLPPFSLPSIPFHPSTHFPSYPPPFPPSLLRHVRTRMCCLWVLHCASHHHTQRYSAAVHRRPHHLSSGYHAASHHILFIVLLIVYFIITLGLLECSLLHCYFTVYHRTFH